MLSQATNRADGILVAIFELVVYKIFLCRHFVGRIVITSKFSKTLMSLNFTREKNYIIKTVARNAR